MQIGMWNILSDGSAIAHLDGKGEHTGDTLIVSVRWENEGFDSGEVFRNAVKGKYEEIAVEGYENNGRAAYYARVLFNGEPSMMGCFTWDGEPDIEEFANAMSPIDVVNEILEHGRLNE